MSMRTSRHSFLLSSLALFIAWLTAPPASADPVAYEHGIDPGVGFNLISWSGSTTSTDWINAIDALDNAGFTEVSISPLRFIDLDNASTSGSLISSGTPSLSGIAAGIARAKTHGMRVTVNPFVEPEGFDGWRGFYNPSGATATRFWSDYNDYLVDVANIAQTNGADSMMVGTELRAIVQDSSHNSDWGAVIGNVNSTFTNGTLGYAANWDNYQNGNLTSTIWENAAIDFVGIDSYFQNMLSNTQADNSGTYPNIDFITDVENAWDNKLSNEILPFASNRKSGSGMPVEFTEIGYLPRNRTSVTPQGESQPLDQDEQNMAFEGFMRALDGRLASGEFLAAHIWQWDMSGSGGSSWNMNPNGGNQPTNQQTAQWLSSFVQGTNPDPGDPPDPNDMPPPGATQVLYSFESGLEGFFYPNFESEPSSTLAQSNGTGNTDGDNSLAITKPTSAWTWDARVQLSGDQLQALQNALADNDENYLFEMDVTYVAGELPGGFSGMDMHLSMESNLDSWTQLNPFATISGPSSQTIHVEFALSDFELTPGLGSAFLTIGFQDTSGSSWSGDATMYIDRIALTDTTYVAPEDADFNDDGVVDGKDFLAWQVGFGIASGATPAQGDANGDGAVNQLDLGIWETQYGTTNTLASAITVPEPSALLLAFAAAGLMSQGRRRRLA